jgi:hypothetical protein
MKKSITLMLIITMIFALTACSILSETPGAQPSLPSDTITQDSTAVNQESSSESGLISTHFNALHAEYVSNGETHIISTAIVAFSVEFEPDMDISISLSDFTDVRVTRGDIEIPVTLSEVIDNSEHQKNWFVVMFSEQLTELGIYRMTYTLFGETYEISGDNAVEIAYLPLSRNESITLFVAQGFEEQEVILRLTIPDYQEFVAGVDESRSGMQIFFGDFSVRIIPNPAYMPNQFTSYMYGNRGGYIRGKIDGDDILMSVYWPQEAIDDWNASSDEIRFEAYGFNDDWIEVSFQRSDIERPLSELMPGVADLRDFVFGGPATISLQAVNNGDGTLTYTYRDTSITNEYYMMPWSWLVTDLGASADVGFWIYIKGKTTDDPNDDDFDNPVNVAMSSVIGISRILGYKFALDSLWDMTVLNILDTIRTTGETHSVEVDENGLCIVWTERELQRSLTIDDIQFFKMHFRYYIVDVVPQRYFADYSFFDGFYFLPVAEVLE